MKTQDWTNRKTEQFIKNDRIVRTLPLGGKMTKAEICLYGNVVITGGAASGAPRYAEVLASLLKRIRVRTSAAPGSRYPDGIIRDYSPRTLLRRAQLFRKKFFSDLNATAVSGAAAVYAIDYRFPIYFAQPDLGRPIETALNCDPDAYQNVQIEIDTGDQNSVFQNNDRAWDFSGLYVDFIDQREAVAGDTYVLVEEDHEYLIDGPGTRKEDKNFPQSGSLLDILFLAQHGSEGAGAAAYADDIVNEIKIAGANCDYDLKGADIKSAMYDPLWGGMDVAQSIVGMYHVNFVNAHRLSKIVPANGLDMKLDLSNPSGAGNDSLLVTARRLFQPSNFAPISMGQKAKKAA